MEPGFETRQNVSYGLNTSEMEAQGGDSHPLTSASKEEERESGNGPDATSSKKGSFERRNPYLFVLLIFIVFLGVDISIGVTLSELLEYSVLAIIAVAIVTKKHWWREIGFSTSTTNRRSLLLFVPAFFPIFWFVAITPMIGYGTIVIPALGTLLLYLGFTLLIGFVEETYFRGMMLRALRSRGLWTATIVTAVLFGAVHFDNLLLGFSPLHTVLQFGYAIALGLAFAALVLVTGLIWPLVLAHGLIDFSALLNSAASSTGVSPSDYVMSTLFVVIFIPYAIILLRRRNSNADRFNSKD